MSKKTSERLQWGALTLMLAALCGWNLYQNFGLKRQIAAYTMEADRLRSSTSAQVDMLMGGQEVATQQEGKTLIWPGGLERILGDSEPADYAGYSVVLYFSELSCNSCLDGETQFLNSLVEVTGGDGVRIVAHANSPRYVRNYARLNGVKAALYFDEDNRFGELNEVRETPMLFLLNDRGEVVSAHYPLPENPAWSDPFHNQILRLFQLI